jgi:hypothetical protein
VAGFGGGNTPDSDTALAARPEILPTNSPNRTIAATMSTTSCTVTIRRASSECGTIPGAPAVVSVPSATASPSKRVSWGAQFAVVPVDTYQVAKSTISSTIAFNVASITQISDRYARITYPAITSAVTISRTVGASTSTGVRVWPGVTTAYCHHTYT